MTHRSADGVPEIAPQRVVVIDLGGAARLIPATLRRALGRYQVEKPKEGDL